MIIRTEGSFCAGHVLSKHPGLCANAHGHNYRVVVEVEFSDFSPEVSMYPVDFGHLKRFVIEPVMEIFDHSFLFGPESPIELSRVMRDLEYKINVLPYEPTAEALAILIANYIKTAMGQHHEYASASELTVQVWETEKSSAHITVKL